MIHTATPLTILDPALPLYVALKHNQSRAAEKRPRGADYVEGGVNNSNF